MSLDIEELLDEEFDEPEEEAEPVERERFVIFELGGDAYAVPVSAAIAVEEAPDPTPVPRSPEAVEGVVDARGAITTVLDARELLPVTAPRPAPETTRVLLFDRSGDGEATGLRVDAIRGVEDVPVPEIHETPDPETPAAESSLVVQEIRRTDEGDEDDEDEETVEERIAVLDATALVAAAGDGNYQ